jgi:hypothetical protein
MIQAIKGALGYVEANRRMGGSEAELKSLTNTQAASLKRIIGTLGSIEIQEATAAIELLNSEDQTVFDDDSTQELVRCIRQAVGDGSGAGTVRGLNRHDTQTNKFVYNYWKDSVWDNIAKRDLSDAQKMQIVIEANAEYGLVSYSEYTAMLCAVCIGLASGKVIAPQAAYRMKYDFKDMVSHMKKHHRLDGTRTLSNFPEDVGTFKLMFGGVWEPGAEPVEPRISPTDINNTMSRLPLRKTSKLLRPDQQDFDPMGQILPAQVPSQNGMMQLLPMMQAFSEFMQQGKTNQRRRSPTISVFDGRGGPPPLTDMPRIRDLDDDSQASGAAGAADSAPYGGDGPMVSAEGEGPLSTELVPTLAAKVVDDLLGEDPRPVTGKSTGKGKPTAKAKGRPKSSPAKAPATAASKAASSPAKAAATAAKKATTVMKVAVKATAKAKSKAVDFGKKAPEFGTPCPIMYFGCKVYEAKDGFRCLPRPGESLYDKKFPFGKNKGQAWKDCIAFCRKAEIPKTSSNYVK